MFFDNGGSATLVNARFHGNNITEHGRGPNILVDGLDNPSDTVLSIYPWYVSHDDNGCVLIISNCVEQPITHASINLLDVYAAFK